MIANIVYYPVNLSVEITFAIIGDETLITVVGYSGIIRKRIIIIYNLVNI